MTTTEIVNASIQLIAVIVPSFITILTLAKRNYINKSIKSIKEEMANGFESNEKQHEQISKTILSHTETLANIIQQKNIATRIRQISKHAIDFCGNRNLGKILDAFTQQLISFIQDVIAIGFQNTTKEQILAKLSVSRDNSNKFAQGVLTLQQVSKWREHTQPIVKKYLKQVFQIYGDVVNNKNARFITKSEDLAQSIVRQFILFSAGLNYELFKKTQNSIAQKSWENNK